MRTSTANPGEGCLLPASRLASASKAQRIERLNHRLEVGGTGFFTASPVLSSHSPANNNLQAQAVGQSFDRVHRHPAFAVHQSRELAGGNARFLRDPIPRLVARLNRPSDRIQKLSHARSVPYWLSRGNYEGSPRHRPPATPRNRHASSFRFPGRGPPNGRGMLCERLSRGSR